jgi:dihydrodipicolinate synthase/N-acetylneuraminate lyase
MTRLEALKALAAKVEAGDRFIDAELVSVFGKFGPPEDGLTWLARNAYHGSLDAAKALHEAVRPGWDVLTIGQDFQDWKVGIIHQDGGSGEWCSSPTNPARAWLMAIIQALIAQEEMQ